MMLGTEYFVLTDGYIDHVFEVDKNNKIDKNLIGDIPSFEQKSDESKVLTKKDLIQIKDPDYFVRSLYEYIYSYQQRLGLRMSSISMINEFYKVLFTKACDESSQKIEFVIDGDIIPVAKKIQTLYRQYRITDDKSSVINLSDELIFELAKKLQKYSLTESKFDSYSISTERLTRLFTRQYGEFFTPRPIGELLVDLIPIHKPMNVLDLTCGTGYILSLVAKNQASFVGIDINSNMVDLARTIIAMGGFKNGEIFLHNSLDTLEELSRVSKNKIKPNSFDMIITHPPFGGIIDKEKTSHFSLSKFPGQKRMEWFFIERSLELLKTGGKLLMIVPDSLLANESNRLIREFVLDHFKILGIISLQNFMHLFETNARASIMILEKTDFAIRDDYDIFSAVPEISDEVNDFTELKETATSFRKFMVTRKGKSIQYSTILESDMKRMDESYFTGLKQVKKIQTQVRALAEIVEISVGIRQNRLKQGGNVFAYVKANNIKDFEIENVSEKLKDKSPVENAMLQENDIVVTRSGTVGNVALVRNLNEKFLISDNVIKLRVKDRQIDPRYLVAFLASELGQAQIKQQSTGTTIKGISINGLARILIPILSLQEQKTIADEFERTLKTKEKMNKSISDYSLAKTSLSKIISKSTLNGAKDVE